jgi:F420-dependent oxidoreductase-like protein
MQIGLFVPAPTIDEVVQRTRQAAERGIRSFWMPQIFELDALTTLAIVGREIPGVALGTAVVPTYPRHPMMLAAQALTVSQASRGHFTLGIGLSHQVVIEHMLGMSFDRPVRHMREYLDVLMPLVNGEPADATGETISFHGGLQIEAAPVPVVVAALGTQMLRLAGRKAQGTITWMTGPATIRDHVVPTITAAATEAGRDAPRVVTALPTCVTDDPDGARERAAKMFEMYGILPSYRAMLDREGAGGPADVAIVGDEASVRAQVEAVLEAGATEFVVVPFANTERTLDLVQSML